MSRHIKIIGAGMDGTSTLTAEARAAADSADVIIGARRVVDMLGFSDKAAFVSYMPEEIARYIDGCGYERIVIAVSGDAGFYSGAARLLERLDGYDIEVIPGISSVSYFFAKLKLPWQGAKLVSLHGADANIARNVRANRLTFFLLGGKVSAGQICERLCEYGMGDVKIYIGENLGADNERILTGAAESLTGIKTGNLCVLTAENPKHERAVRSGIPDDEFIRGNTPMTKAEIRAVCAAKLEIGNEDICWDIGCGTGSVSVEMALRCADGRVYAVDRSDEAVRLTDANRRKFGCDNIEITLSDAADAVSDLTAPDCVFIGGSGGEIARIINAAREKNPGVKIVAAAITLETLEKCRAAFEAAGMTCEITQIAVTRTRRVGAHTMMSAQNPVFIIGGGGK